MNPLEGPAEISPQSQQQASLQIPLPPLPPPPRPRYRTPQHAPPKQQSPKSPEQTDQKQPPQSHPHSTQLHQQTRLHQIPYKPRKQSCEHESPVGRTLSLLSLKPFSFSFSELFPDLPPVEPETGLSPQKIKHLEPEAGPSSLRTSQKPSRRRA